MAGSAWVMCLALSGCASTTVEEVDFARDVKPILEQRCVICHNAQTLPGKPSFETRALACQPGPRGVPLVPGNPEASRILAVIALGEVDEQAMPPVSHRVSDGEKQVLERWIAEGAPWPEGEAGRLVPPFRALE